MTGLIIGKFYPPHLGHTFLIDTARAQVDHLTVMVCAEPRQSIPGHLRLEWMRELHPTCNVVLVEDTLGDDFKLWAEFCVDYLGYSPDLVFSSERYGEPFASAMGSRHVLVDLDRLNIPISATAIRDNPFQHWEFLAPCVRAYFVKRIVLVGAESTGKTTLAQQLADVYETEWVPEYGREYVEKRFAGVPLGEQNHDWAPEEFEHIAETQNAREIVACRTANKVLFCDTNAMVTSVWQERYTGQTTEKVVALRKAAQVDLYLVTDPTVTFKADSIRDGEATRQELFDRFLFEAEQSGVPYIRLRGSVEHCISQARAAVDAMIQFPSRGELA